MTGTLSKPRRSSKPETRGITGFAHMARSLVHVCFGTHSCKATASTGFVQVSQLHCASQPPLQTICVAPI